MIVRSVILAVQDVDRYTSLKKCGKGDLMPRVTDLGKEGPHPDIMDPLLERISEAYSEMLPSEGIAELRFDEVQILQKRTLYGLRWSSLQGQGWSYDQAVVNVDVSVGLAVCSPSGGRKQMVLYQAHRLPDRDWGIARLGFSKLEEPPKKPWTSIPKLSRGFGIAWGVLTHSPDVGKGRITLENGYISESPVSNSSFLLFVPFHTAELWASSVRFGFYDTLGREIVTDNLSLPAPPQVPRT